MQIEIIFTYYRLIQKPRSMGWLTKRLRCGASSSCGATSAAKSVEDTASAPVEDTASAPITTLVFDIDDTLYDVGCGFTEHRNGGAVFSFMVKKLGFKNAAAAKVVRDESFYRPASPPDRTQPSAELRGGT